MQNLKMPKRRQEKRWKIGAEKKTGTGLHGSCVNLFEQLESLADAYAGN
ncbi:hypothetical protein PQR62_16595 [Herbaspirillum lusitanum]|uniref:Uncharacterized protein n=1 Tax=Herbaspirillum lusitanum TaxID=213312 RepID=A0ABW9AAQ0_9BURK